MKKYLSKVTGGANLLRPKLSPGYIVAAMVAVMVLLIVITGGKWLAERANRLAQSIIPSAPNIDYKAKLGI